MKNTITTFALIIGFLSFSQRPDGPPPHDMGKQSEKMRAAKISHLTNKLSLTPQETEKFWPIYNNFEKQSRILKREIHQIINNSLLDNNGMENISENDAKEILLKITLNKESIHQLEKKFDQDLLTIISAKKILKLHHAEKEFNRKLLHKLRERRRK